MMNMDDSDLKKNIILIDWGTTNVRAYLVDSLSGEVVDRRQNDKGIKYVPAGSYPEVYAELTYGWLDTAKFTLMAGMVGSANGWEEAAYVPLPASPLKVGEHIHTLTSVRDVYIVGGLSCKGVDNTYDVIRGEEVQIIGLLAKIQQGKKLVCMPGTHSKWLEVDGNNNIDSFTTVMSGDFFSAICTSTIMTMMLDIPQDFSPTDFARGVALSVRPGGIMAHMFKVRSALLFDQIKPEHIESMISGIVIGSEINSMKEVYDTSTTVHVVASVTLAERYSQAFEILEIAHQVHSGDTLSLEGMRFLASTMA